MTRSGMRIDNYTLTRQLGTNGFGPVWAARESIIERLVSINFLASTDEYEIARFIRAISLLSRLNHPSIAVHTGHGFHNHIPYLATEYLQGPTLATLMAQGGRMDELRVLQIAVQVADALDHAWSRAQVIHRSLGPQSIMIDLASMQGDQNTVSIRVTDFGHALGKRLIDSHDPAEVAEEAAFQAAALKEIVGTPMTMSPEQIAGARLTVASDMYALGITMYGLLTGSPPFTGSDEAVKASHQRANPLELQSLLPNIQPGTAALVKRLLSKTPSARFADWDSCRQKLQATLDLVERQRAPRQIPVTAPTPVAATTTSHSKKTSTFERTPIGHAIPGGPVDESLSPPPPPPSGPYYPRPAYGQTGGGHAALPPGQGYPPQGYPTPRPGAGLSAEDVQILAAHAARLRMAGIGGGHVPPVPAAALASAAITPEVDDGLTQEQRMALWAQLFRSPAILDAAVTSTTPPAGGEVLPVEQEPAHDDHDLPSASDETQPEADQFDDIPGLGGTTDEPPQESQTFAELFVVKDPNAEATEAPRPASDIPTNPLQSRHWKPALEILREAVFGVVKRDSAPAPGVTKRFTRSLLRLVSKGVPANEETLNLILSGQFDEAEARLEKIVPLTASDGTPVPDPTACVLRARLQGLRGDYQGALGWAQQAIQLHSPDPVAMSLVGTVHLHLRRVQTSISVFDEAAQLHPESPLGPFGQGVVLFLGGLNQKAEQALNEAERRRMIPALTRFRALCCRSAGDVEGEVHFLQQLLTNDGSDWAIRERMAELGAEAPPRRRTDGG